MSQYSKHDLGIVIGSGPDFGQTKMSIELHPRYSAAKLLQPLVKPNLKPSVRDRIDEVLEMPKGYEYVEVLRQNHYERHYRNRSGHTATRGIPLNSVERKRKKKYFLRKVRADDDGDQTTFASVPQKDSLLLVENLRGRLG